MRLIKVLGLAGLSVLAAMAFVGTSSATATGTTALCETNVEICSESKLVTLFHLFNTEGTVVSFLNQIANVLCLSVSSEGKSLHAGIPQKINSVAITFTGCGTSAAHNNCVIEFKILPTFTLLKTTKNLGTLSITNGELLVKCTILGIVKINCTYSTAGLEFGAEGALHNAGTGHGMITATNTPLEGGTGTCPEKTPTLDFLLEPTEHTYIAGVGNLSTALCKVHQDPCQSGNLVKTLHISTADPSLLVPYEGKTIAVACGSSLVTADVGPLGAPQEISIEEFTWTGCKVGANSCTVTTVEMGTLYLYRTGLNVGNAAATDNEFEVTCTNPSFTCNFTGEPTLSVEGAEHTGGAGHGMFRATETELENTAGECEGPAILHGLFEPLIDVSVVS